ncbi:MAG: S8 family serine peptidase, partial [Caldilineaceae bacterium]|nr:S8 family serine peptidase [Caldilineaceae bacterium]
MHLCIVLLRQPTMANASSGTELAQANSTASPSQFHKQCYLLGALLLAVSLLLGLRLTVAAGDISPLDLSRHALITQKPEGSFQPAIQHGDDDENPAGSDEIELEGSILSAPDHTQGYGEWTIRALSGRIYRVIADSETEFRPQLPAIGQSVKVKGRLRSRDQGDEIVATRIEIEDEREDESKPDELQGILVSAPSDGIGTWIVQTGFTQTISIVVDSTTRLDDGVPPAGRWLEVRGRWQTDNTFLAARIRVEDHRINEVVVRLTQNVVSTTVASRYGLLPKETLIRSGNIHLFVTQEDEEHNIVTKLTADPDVLWAELNYVGGIPEGHGYKTWRWGGTTADGYVNQGAFDQVNLAPALTAYRGKDVIVAVLDTGINQAHKAFVGRLLPGYDMVDDDADPEDEGDGVGWGHGTHVAGI